MKEPQLHTLICSAKSPAQLRRFDNFYIEEYEGTVTVEIYFKIKYIYSSILLYISRNFTHLINDPMISLLPKEQFKLLLKHKMLNVTHEDEVVKAICGWVGDGTNGKATELEDLLSNVNWTYVSIPCFLDLIRSYPVIRRHPSFRSVVLKEFQFRLKFSPDTSSLDPPRFSYKYSKYSS